jgi:N-dimethylarginine dimethylaminohydrolase
MAVTLCGAKSEYENLTSVMLYRPGPEIGNYPDPIRIQHLAPINYLSLMREFGNIIACFENLGVTVNLIDPAQIDDERDYLYNMMYCRDLLFMTPRGAIMASMANAVRRAEPLHAARFLEAHGIPLLHTVAGAGRFEGADALWLKDDLVLVGVGNRTNREGFRQVREILEPQGVECLALPSHQVTTQHLLGSIQLVDRDLALVRHEIIAAEVIAFLEERNITVVKIPENLEVRERQAMNIVTVAPRRVIMTAGCPETKRLFREAGVTIAAELDLTQLINGAGGLACATGIIARAGKA